jgi:ubiquinone/menaquinone biosynthesis C-methylase UbiE
VSVRERIFAALYDPLSKRWEENHGGELKRGVLMEAHGRVLEIGVGTGLSFPHYPHVDELVGIDPSEGMLRRAHGRSAELGQDVTLLSADAEQLPFEDASFDTVVCLMVLCTVDDPRSALVEIRRVLRPGGRLLFLEHVRSTDPRQARWQDRLERPWGWIAGGCRPNRRTLEAITSAGFELAAVEQHDEAGMPALVSPLVSGTAQ